MKENIISLKTLISMKKKKNLFLKPYMGKEEQTAENYFPNIL